MPRTRRPYSAEFRRRLVELVRDGQTPEELAQVRALESPLRYERLQAIGGPQTSATERPRAVEAPGLIRKREALSRYSAKRALPPSHDSW